MNINPETEYQVALNKHTSEGEIQWSRYNAILVVNTIFIALMGFTYKNEAPTLLRHVLSPLGILLCLLWYRITERGFMWSDFWIRKARECEEKFSNKNNIRPIISGNVYKSEKEVIIDTKLSAYLVITIFVIIYVLIFANNTVPLICTLCQK